VTRYEIVRDTPREAWFINGEWVGAVQRHPEQPSEGFASATEASLWCETPPRQLGGEWYIRPVEGK
jgi:hypothetical protein